MTRVARLLVVVTVLTAMLAPEPVVAEKKKKSGFGVTGTINGKNFKATNVQGAEDPCVNGIYEPTQGILVFSALECRGKRRRRQGTAVRKHFKVVVISCSNLRGDPTPPVPPYEGECSGAYTENRTGRFGIPVSMTTWTAIIGFSGLQPISPLRMRLDAFDGTTVRGVLVGAFDRPEPGASGSAAISGEMAFHFPVRVQ
jgi:hypothetical protein